MSAAALLSASRESLGPARKLPSQHLHLAFLSLPLLHFHFSLHVLFTLFGTLPLLDFRTPSFNQNLSARAMSKATPTFAPFDWDAYEAYPSLPLPYSVVYSTGDELVTYTDYDGSPQTTLMSQQEMPVSTSFGNAAAGAAYTKAVDAWYSSVNAQGGITSYFPEATQIMQKNGTSPILAATTTAAPTGQGKTQEAAPPSSHRGSNKGVIAGVLIALLLVAAGAGAWLWRRQRRTGQRFSLGSVCASTRRRQYDTEERAERDMTQTPNAMYMSAGRSTNELLEPMSPAVSLASNANPFLDSSSNISALQPLSPASAMRRGSVRSFASSSLGSSVSQRGAGECDSVAESHESDSVLGAPSISIASTRSSQRPIQSEGPYPLPPRSPGGASFLASLARSRAHKLPPNPLVDEKFLGPKDRGLVGSEAGDSFDWRRCSFATDEERAMWIKARSEGSVAGSVASGASKSRTSVDSRYLQTSAPEMGARRTSWRSIGMHSFATADERAMWLRASSSREAASSRASVSTDASNAWSSGEHSEELTWQGRAASNSSGTSSEPHSSLPTPATAYARPSLGINTDLKRHRSHQPSPLSAASDPFASDSPGIQVHEADPFADQSTQPSGLGFA